MAWKKDASDYTIKIYGNGHNILTWYSLLWTDDWYSVISEHRESTGGDNHPHRAQRSSSGHMRISRAVLGGGLTINILPDNTTRGVVRAEPQCFMTVMVCGIDYVFGFWHVLFVLVGVKHCPILEIEFTNFHSLGEVYDSIMWTLDACMTYFLKTVTHYNF